MASSTLAREYMSGSIASSFTYALFSPLEVVKTRLQLQDAPGWKRVYFHGSFLGTCRDVLRQDGLLLFWSHGLVAGVCRDFFYSGVRTGMYPTVRNLFASRRAASEASLLEKIAAGATTGSVGAGLANAADVVRVRMVAEGGRTDPKSGMLLTGLRAGHAPRWTSSVACLADTARSEGFVRGLLLRGVGASMSRAGLLTAAQMATYDQVKTVGRRRGLHDGASLHMGAALLSGFAATVACNPADVVKSRLMSGVGVGSTSTLRTAWHLLRREGVRGFYRGFLPAWARIGPTIFIRTVTRRRTLVLCKRGSSSERSLLSSLASRTAHSGGTTKVARRAALLT